MPVLGPNLIERKTGNAVPTSAWHRDKLRRDDITFTEDQQEHGRGGQGQGEGGNIKTPMVEVKTLPQLHRLELTNL